MARLAMTRQMVAALCPMRRASPASFHFVVDKGKPVMVEGVDGLVHSGHFYRQAQHPPLRTVESVGRESDAFVGQSRLVEFVHQFLGRFHGVWAGGLGRPLAMVDEGILHPFVTYPLVAFVETEHAVDSNAGGRDDKRVDGHFGLHGAAGADPDEAQCFPFAFDFFGAEVYVGERVELVHHDVDVVRSDSGGEHGDPRAPVGTGYGMELPVASFQLDAIEMSGHHAHAAGVAHQNNLVGQFLRSQMEVENRPVVVGYQFR